MLTNESAVIFAKRTIASLVDNPTPELIARINAFFGPHRGFTIDGSTPQAQNVATPT